MNYHYDPERRQHELVFYMSNSVLGEIVADIERSLAKLSPADLGNAMMAGPGETAPVSGADLLKMEILRFDVAAGLPHLDYGQTVEICFRETDYDPTTAPAYETRFKGRLLMGA